MRSIGLLLCKLMDLGLCSGGVLVRFILQLGLSAPQARLHNMFARKDNSIVTAPPVGRPLCAV